MNRPLRFISYLFSAGLLMLILGIVATVAIFAHYSKELPEIDAATDFALAVPLRVYSADNELIGEFGVQRRTPVTYEELPQPLINAFLSAEDDRFFEHPGVDYQGILRAVINLVVTGERGQGGSTITMQLARNLFLSPEKSYERKLKEILLAMKLERELSKEKILELYLNKIYLGNRAYGVAAAGQVYYGEELANLSIAQTAMIAGLPKAPSKYNPIINPQRALQRRNYVIRRMAELDYIDAATAEAATAESVSANLQQVQLATDAGYIVEMARDEVYRRFGDAAYTDGYIIRTTINSEEQNAANAALRTALLDYDVRHGYRGAEGKVDINKLTEEQTLADLISDYNTVGGLEPAVVTSLDDRQAYASLRDGTGIVLEWDAMKWARPYIDEGKRGPEPQSSSDILAVGDVIRVTTKTTDSIVNWQLSQIPAAQSAFVALNPSNGAVRALVGGFDFQHSKFNRVTQAQRQPGSSFKPFLYSAALAKGFTPASLVNDAPVVFEDENLEAAWRPENYSGKFYGPTRLRKALVNSRNLVSIRILRSIGIAYTIDYVEPFGFNKQRLPRDLSLSLGSAAVTPLELAGAYSTFANGGFKVTPWVIQSIEKVDGSTVYQANPAYVCEGECQTLALEAYQQELAESELTASNLPFNQAEPVNANQASATDSTALNEDVSSEQTAIQPPKFAPRIMSAENNYLMNSMLRDVVRVGTAQRAKQLGRNDLAGKTGTTNDQIDAWFAGYTPQAVGIAWVGFDKVAPLGSGEVGGRAALPVWMGYMQAALQGVPENPLLAPPGIETIRISKETGERASPSDGNAMFEVFDSRYVPEALPTNSLGNEPIYTQPDSSIVEELF